MWAEAVKTLKNTSEKLHLNNVATLLTKRTFMSEFFKELLIIIQTLTFQSTSSTGCMVNNGSIGNRLLDGTLLTEIYIVS